MVEFIWLWMPWFSMNLNHWSPIAATVQIRPVVHVSIFPPPPRAFLFSSSVVFEGSPRIIRKYGVWAFRANDHWTHRQAWRLRGKTKILLYQILNWNVSDTDFDSQKFEFRNWSWGTKYSKRGLRSNFGVRGLRWIPGYQLFVSIACFSSTLEPN